MNKWKIAFLISTITGLLVIIGVAYIVFSNTLVSGHCKDNEIIVAEDLEQVSIAISAGARTIDEFDKELEKINTGHWTEKEYQTIRLKVVHLIFDENGNFKRIETYGKEQ